MALKRGAIIGDGPVMNACLDRVSQYADSEFFILNYGGNRYREGIVRRAIHENSRRRVIRMKFKKNVDIKHLNVLVMYHKLNLIHCGRSMQEEKSEKDLTTWLREHFFKSHPFDHLVAETEDEKNLRHYFVRFPFYEEIKKPKCTFLFLRRGEGKSANRILLKHEWSKEEAYPQLAVEYTDFYRLIKEEQIELKHHVEGILRQATPALYEFIKNRLESKKHISGEGHSKNHDAEKNIKDLVWFIARYSDLLNPSSIDKQIYKVEGLKEEEKNRILNDMLNITKKVITPILPAASPLIEIVSSFFLPQAIKDALPEIKHSPLELMNRFGEIAKSYGVKYIYILIDRVDEYAQIHDLEKASNMIKPLVETIPLLEMEPFVFKFFLPAKLRDNLSQHFRSDRFDVYPYSEPLWSKDELKQMFQDRLDVFCDQESLPGESDRRSFIRLFETEIREEGEDVLLSQLIDFANHSPRNLLKMAKLIFDEHTRSKPIAYLIKEQTYEKVLSQFASEQIKWRSMAEPSVKKLGDLYLTKNIFSLTDVICSLQLSKSDARNIIQKWEDAGLVSAEYIITDEALVRYITKRREGIE